MISLFDSKAWPNLKLPLSWEDLSICSWNFNSCVKTTFIVSINNWSSKIYISSYWTVIWTLASWETRTWPSVWSCLETVVLLKKNVFLLNTEPWFFIRFSIKDLFCVFSKVSICWSKFFKSSISPLISFTENHDVISSSEWIREIKNWLQNDFWTFSSCLICWRAIIIPFW